MKDRKEEPHFQVTDRRFWIQDESMVDKAAVPEQRHPSYVEELKARTELAEQRLRQKLEQLEKENEAFRRRIRGEIEKRMEQDKMRLFRDFLEVIDNLERALESADNSTPEALREGVRLNLQLLLNKLKQSAGIEPIDVLGKPFDPTQSEAIGVMPVNNPEQDHQVVEVLQRGYRCGERLLRPASVRVGQYQSNSN
ncbi:MAG: nucleotide exchange factor GrpE [Acidobacteriota bacterium]